MYGLADLDRDLDILQKQGAKVFSIGKTVLGRDIPCVFKGGMAGGQTLIQAAMHAREYPTTAVVMKMMMSYEGSGGVWCVPMVNIDGVLLCQEGVSSVADPALREYLIEINGGSTDFSNWKANARGVDINVNFNANWGTGALNITYPAPANYIGEYPDSEPETQAMVSLTQKVQPQITLSYHTKGDVIFWGYKDILPYPEYTKMFSQNTGYPLLESGGSAGGYKDWFVLTTERIGLTFEVGSPDLPTPIPMSAVEDIYKKNSGVLYLSEEVITLIEKDAKKI